MCKGISHADLKRDCNSIYRSYTYSINSELQLFNQTPNPMLIPCKKLQTPNQRLISACSSFGMSLLNSFLLLEKRSLLDLDSNIAVQMIKSITKNSTFCSQRNKDWLALWPKRYCRYNYLQSIQLEQLQWNLIINTISR